MKHIIISAIILTLSIGYLSAESSIGLTLRLRGEITLTRQEQTDPLNEGGTLVNEDIVRSFEHSFALIKFVDDGATLRLFENSILTLNTEKEDDKLHKNNFLQVGNVFTSVRSNTGDLSIETPTTVASVKGTEGFVVVNEDGTTLVIVLKGSYEVFNKVSGRTITIQAGYTGTSDGTGALSGNPTDEIDEDWLDAVEDLLEDNDIYRIEVIREDGEKKIIEIELD